MRIERRLFIEVKSHWSYVCALCELFETHGWKVVMRPDLNAVDVIKYRFDGFDIVDDMPDILSKMKSQWGDVRSIYDLNDPDRVVRYIE